METDDFTKRGIEMVDQKNTLKTKMIKGIVPSILLLVIILTSLTGATYAWFIAGSNNETVFTAGTVELSQPTIVQVDVESEEGSNYAFIPNAEEASVSKVDLVNFEEVARYSTVEPRPSENLADFRVSRLAMDSAGNAWAINTMTGQNFDYKNATSSIARISASEVQGEAPGINTSDRGGSSGIVDNDVRVSYYNIGDPGDGPRTINIVEENNQVFLWIGFYNGKYFQKYEYDEINENLIPLVSIDIETFSPYYAAIDPNGYMWVSSRNASPYPSTGVPGVIRFNTNNLSEPLDTLDYEIPENHESNPYSIIVDSSGSVWVSDGGDWNTKRERYFAVYEPGNTTTEYISSGVSEAMRGFIEYGDHIWATTIDGQVRKGTEENNSWEFQPLITGLEEMAGIGPDASGNLWVVRYGINSISRFDPSSSEDGINETIGVGTGPYAYDNFTLPGSSCKKIKWEFENIGSKSVYVRVRPSATINGASVNIGLCNGSDNWQKSTDGWWYYGSGGTGGEPFIVYPQDHDSAEPVFVCFEYCFAGSDPLDLEVSLEAEAIQWSNSAIDHEWSNHPWDD